MGGEGDGKMERALQEKDWERWREGGGVDRRGGNWGRGLTSSNSRHRKMKLFMPLAVFSFMSAFSWTFTGKRVFCWVISETPRKQTGCVCVSRLANGFEVKT